MLVTVAEDGRIFPLCYRFFLRVMVYTVQQFEWSMVSAADVLYIGGIFPVYYEFLPVIR